MDYSKKIAQTWGNAMLQLEKKKAMQMIRNFEFNLSHYQSILLETYHNAGFNPQQQVFATAFFKNNPRSTIKRFYQHAISEIGHDLLAMDDLVALGADRDKMMRSKPLPATEAFNAFPIFQVMFRNPIGYLGYLYHLEHFPTQSGKGMIQSLEKIGVPENARSFIEEHSTVDVAHNKMMESYIKDLVQNDEDCEAVCYAAVSSARLHVLVFEEAFARGNDPNWMNNLSTIVY